MITKASKMLGFVLRNSKMFRNHNTKIILYNSLVRSILEYGSVVWRPHYATHCLRIERVQKRFLYHLAFAHGRAKEINSYSKKLTYFKMHTLNNRRDLLDLMYLYKCLKGTNDNPDLISKLRFNVPYRYPRKPITLLVRPLRRTVLGRNSPISRLSQIFNDHKEVLDPFRDTLYKYKFKIVRHILTK